MKTAVDLTVGQAQPVATDELAARTIRDLVDTYPQVLTVLDPLGIDLCCGGGHPLGEALDLHGLDRAAVLPQVARVIAGADSPAE